MATRPDPVDIHVGEKLRRRRSFLGMSQDQLGTSLGITFQQIQKYERGANRIGASRLYNICQILEVSPAFFFDGLQSKEAAGLAEDEQTTYRAEGVIDKEAMDLVRAYRQITNPVVRRRMLELIRAIARGEDE